MTVIDTEPYVLRHGAPPEEDAPSNYSFSDDPNAAPGMDARVIHVDFMPYSEAKDWALREVERLNWKVETLYLLPVPWS